MDGNHVTAPITRDGHQEMALIDTGADYSDIDQSEEENLFHLTLGSDDTPESGPLNNDKTLKTHQHIFKNLAFGDVAVNNPLVTIIPATPR